LDWPCGQNPAESPKAADAQVAREAMSLGEQSSDPQGQHLVRAGVARAPSLDAPPAEAHTGLADGPPEAGELAALKKEVQPASDGFLQLRGGRGVDCQSSPSLRASPEACFLAARHLLQKGALMTSTIALVRHRVADFDAWKKVYDGFAPIQAEYGVHGHQVLRSIENPNDVIVTHTFDSREAASAFFATPELKEAMSKAGVNADSVEISYFDEVEAGALVGV
jgi:quinol monooxygenase YgiN